MVSRGRSYDAEVPAHTVTWKSPAPLNLKSRSWSIPATKGKSWGRDSDEARECFAIHLQSHCGVPPWRNLIAQTAALTVVSARITKDERLLKDMKP